LNWSCDSNIDLELASFGGLGSSKTTSRFRFRNSVQRTMPRAPPVKIGLIKSIKSHGSVRRPKPHVKKGLLNSSDAHGSTAPCFCHYSKNPPADMPRECQAILLVDEWMPSWFELDTEGQGASSARYEARRIWASKMGITGIRVDIPACVKTVIIERSGAGSTTFVAGVNNCGCETCETYIAEH
jgi:hypothetical protein